MMNDNQVNMMLHALGIEFGGLPYRNKYCLYSRDDDWEDLINKGLAKVFVQNISGKKHYFYWVTLEGQKALGLKGECIELGCQNKFYGYNRLSPEQEVPVCRKHYYQYR